VTRFLAAPPEHFLLQYQPWDGGFDASRQCGVPHWRHATSAPFSRARAAHRRLQVWPWFLAARAAYTEYVAPHTMQVRSTFGAPAAAFAALEH
jgi:hypothetical protein